MSIKAKTSLHMSRFSGTVNGITDGFTIAVRDEESGCRVCEIVIPAAEMANLFSTRMTSGVGEFHDVYDNIGKTRETLHELTEIPEGAISKGWYEEREKLLEECYPGWECRISTGSQRVHKNIDGKSKWYLPLIKTRFLAKE